MLYILLLKALLGFTTANFYYNFFIIYADAATPDFPYAEDYKSTYDDKGNLIERNGSISGNGQPSGGFNDAWTYDCK